MRQEQEKGHDDSCRKVQNQLSLKLPEGLLYGRYGVNISSNGKRTQQIGPGHGEENDESELPDRELYHEWSDLAAVNGAAEYGEYGICQCAEVEKRSHAAPTGN